MIVNMANENQSRITEDFATVQALIDSHEIVMAVWQDRSQALGVDYLVVKGAQRLAQGLHDNVTFQARMTAIPCNDAAQAMALRMVAGDKPN